MLSRHAFLLLLLLLVPTVQVTANTGTPFFRGDTLPKEELIKLQRIEELMLRSPHYKNPDAAGRLAVINRNAPAPPEETTKVVLTGPAYKNRQPRAMFADTSSTPAPAVRRLMGPRYKNRRAGTGRHQ